ncbi:MAG TPA: hypothetical protein VNA20_02100 [Frankiaceae bacterium]|nr:hypothetical protein [Frankiaceae bacterium]
MPAFPAQGDDDGASATEYAMLAAAIAAMIVVILWSLGRFVYDVYEDSCEHIATTTSAGQDC